MGSVLQMKMLYLVWNVQEKELDIREIGIIKN